MQTGLAQTGRPLWARTMSTSSPYQSLSCRRHTSAAGNLGAEFTRARARLLGLPLEPGAFGPNDRALAALQHSGEPQLEWRSTPGGALGMANPWTTKNPVLSLWLGGANRAAAIARGHALAEASRWRAALVGQAARFWCPAPQLSSQAEGQAVSVAGRPRAGLR